ncbi:MAG TPA: AAA family ATPase [Kofleriaceae bacterium]|nr:AAA family ATPase [Kofleriaceae bacterium]
MLTLAPGAAIDWAAVEAWFAPIVPASELEATPQDPGFHAEGDVWTHTVLALEALVDGARYAALDPVGQTIVATAVALHDIGKPSTTRLEGERWTSRGHSLRGETITRVALWRQDVPFAIREHVCALVRSHQVPFFGITKPEADAVRLAHRLAFVTRHDWLTAVADADGRGRRCADPADRTKIVEHCALWGEHCRELGVLDRPPRFASEHARRLYFEGGTRPPEAPVHDDTTCEAVLMSGLPASGKDTWLREHRPALPVISLDELRSELDVDPDDSQADVIARAREQARTYLRAGQSFAWNATNLSPQLRGQLLALFRSYRARTHIVYCETSAGEQMQRNRSRSNDRVPAAVIDRMLSKWSVPDPTEAHQITYAVARTPGGVTWPPQADPAV